MKRFVRKIVTFTAVFGAFLLLPSTSQAGSTVEFLVINTGNTSANGDYCGTKGECQHPDAMFAGALQPALEFDLANDQTIHIQADLFDGFDCVNYIQTPQGDIPFPAGHDIVFLRFDPPLDPGTQLSMAWTLGTCDPRPCANYEIATGDPAMCME